MIVVINRVSHVEVRDGTKTIFRKNKPPNHGGMTGRLLAAFGIVETGVYHISGDDNIIRAIEVMHSLDARVPTDAEHADELVFRLQTLDKEVNRVF